jgi:hypothetical protein
MATSIWGLVKDGKVLPGVPLPEGARVQIIVTEEQPAVPPELSSELAAWGSASAAALDLVERLAQEEELRREP